MLEHLYLYSFNYDYHNSALCKLESRQLFDKEEKNKILFSDRSIDPSITPFIKNRVELISYATNYQELLIKIKSKKITVEDFNVEYLSLRGDLTGYTERREKSKDIGYSIEGQPNFKRPSITYAICKNNNIYYFGVLLKHDIDWHKHKHKPCSFSNSINMDIAKSLVCIATKGDTSKDILDSCCGVGTIILEGCISGFNIEGCDINPKSCKHKEKNLNYYGYTSTIYCTDIKSIAKKYNTAIIDLPYNLYSYSNELITANIIHSTVKLTNRVIIVSITDIRNLINETGLQVIDSCSVQKRGKSKFSRKIWVCEKVS